MGTISKCLKTNITIEHNTLQLSSCCILMLYRHLIVLNRVFYGAHYTDKLTFSKRHWKIQYKSSIYTKNTGILFYLAVDLLEIIHMLEMKNFKVKIELRLSLNLLFLRKVVQYS